MAKKTDLLSDSFAWLDEVFNKKRLMMTLFQSELNIRCNCISLVYNQLPSPTMRPVSLGSVSNPYKSMLKRIDSLSLSMLSFFIVS